MTTRRKIVYAGGIIILAGGGLAAWYARDTSAEESERLATLLELKPERVIAEVGAGRGQMTISAAERVGATGHVFSTELEPSRLEDIQRAARQRHLTNVTVLKAGEADSNLPAACCDAIFMRDVYHHFTHPVEIDASLFKALRAGGSLAVIDFRPRWWLSLIAPIKAAPKSHGGHGIPQQVLIQEVTAAGFQVSEVIEHWPGRGYCVVFRKRL
jgi:predicted methyltransferase